MKKTFFCLAAMLFSLVATAQDDYPTFKSGKLYYQIVDQTNHWAQVTAPTNGNPYQDIGTSDFSATVTHEGVEYTVYGIGPGAFMNATLTGMVTLPEGMIYIDNGAFDGSGNSSGGSGVRLPATMQFVSEIAFVNNKLGHITVQSNNPYFAKLAIEPQGSLVNMLTNKEGNRLIAFPGHKLVSATGEGTYVSQVTIPDQITEIAPYAFYGNSDLTNVTFHSGITSIEHRAFTDCRKLTSVRLPSAGVVLGESVWSGCVNVASVSLPENIVLNKHDFYCCSIENLTVPEGVNVIPMMCFAGNELKSLSLPESLERIDSCGFQNNPDLSSVNLKNVKRLEHFAFMGCTGLTSYTCNGQLEYISTTVFCNTGLVDAMLPEGLKFMDGNVFFSTNSLKTITIPSTVETIMFNPVTKCPNVKRIQVAEGNTHFAELDSCLYEINEAGNPVRLVSVPQGRENTVLRVPDGVTVIAKQAARNVELTEVYLPASVQELESSAFSTITATTQVTSVATEPPTIEEGSAFFSNEVFANATLYVPLPSVEKYQAATGWKEFQHIEGIDTGDEPAEPGDFNGDGGVDVEDVNVIINLILEGINVPDNTDLNGDGITDISDLNELINIILAQ
ncbi:MAG: leucine-rich repeat protein [Muribaculaceae bacterium]|nr:leucine-rich repeat protein [Muribaculaceae bacterium]